MDAERVEAILTACEEALASSYRVDLRRLKFWQAVEAVKRHPDWVDRYAERIARIDRQAFERATAFTLPPTFGVALLAMGTVIGVVLVLATYVAPRRWKGGLVLAGTGVLLGATHDLAHFLVGRALGMRFSHLFLGGPLGLRPGLKTDYATYLRTPPQARAWMHASGALVTKAVPFIVLSVTAATRVPSWARLLLLGIGVVQIVTDVLFSTRFSDWKRFRRELRLARQVS